ncbi:MAG: hypothetical protein JW709_12925 [Sedimentisphaerales bacterium]|nr:hypothetical protein [Sedimentisphaerales bacterium]
MNDFLLRVQDALLACEGLTLVIAGAITIVGGLFLWLGGARFAGLVLGVCGGGVGAVLGLLAGHWLEVHPALCALVGAAVLALAAILLKKVVIVILAAIIFTCIAGMTYLSYQYNNPVWQNKLSEIRSQAMQISPQGGTSEQSSESSASSAEQRRMLFLQEYHDAATLAQSEKEQAQGKLQALWAELRYSLGEHRTGVVLWAILGGVIGLALAYLVMKVMMALCFSLVGATSVIVGVALLLFAKGTLVVTYLMDRPRVLPVIFCGMVALGLIVQLFITRQPKKAAEESEEKEEEKKKS